MMSSYSEIKLRKCSDVDEKYCSYELASGSTPLLAISANDDGVPEVYFAVPGVEAVIEYDKFLAMLQDGRRWLQEEIDEQTGRKNGAGADLAN